MYKFFEFFTPVIEVMSNGVVYRRLEVCEKVANALNLTDEQKAMKIKSGTPVYVDRTQWAI